MIKRTVASVAVPILVSAFAASSFAQTIQREGVSRGSTQPGKTTERETPEKQGSAWTLDLPLGIHFPATIDTLTYNYQRQTIPSMISDAYASQGNLGGEGINMIFFNRPGFSKFFFDDAIAHWIPTFAKQKFYNVYTPTTLLSYNFGGNKENAQNRLNAVFAGNVNRRIGVGAHIDYIHSKGCYENQAAKNFNFGLSFYYLGDRYEAQAFFNRFNTAIKANGGITDDLYITDPGELQGGDDKIESKSIPTRLTQAQNRLNGSEFYMNHAYKIGYWEEEQVNDTLSRRIYVPVTKILYSLDYRSGHHEFTNYNGEQGREYWSNSFFNADRTVDNTRYWTLSNTVGISMIEGFKKWAKFGIAAYATVEYRNYSQVNPDEYTVVNKESEVTPYPTEWIDPHATSNLLWVGGRINKQKGSIIKYNADAKFGLVGSVAGDIDINGDISARFRMLGDTVGIRAYGYFRNQAVPYLLQKYISNHFIWSNNFGKIRTFRVGGELQIPWTKTVLRAGVENLQNYVYFDSSSMPSQYGGSVQVFSATLDQKLKFGIWNWNNTITYQATSNADVIPLPALSIYSNMFLHFRAFKVLDLQIGVDCDWYTRYYGLELQPATMTFHTQHQTKVGNYAFCNAYVTARLYKVRFYVLWSHVNQGLFSKEYFSMPHYPVNPRRLMLGVSVDFAN